MNTALKALLLSISVVGMMTSSKVILAESESQKQALTSPIPKAIPIYDVRSAGTDKSTYWTVGWTISSKPLNSDVFLYGYHLAQVCGDEPKSFLANLAPKAGIVAAVAKTVSNPKLLKDWKMASGSDPTTSMATTSVADYLKIAGLSGIKVEYLPIADVEEQLKSLKENWAVSKVTGLADHLKNWRVAGGKVEYLPIADVEEQLKGLKKIRAGSKVTSLADDLKNWKVVGGKASAAHAIEGFSATGQPKGWKVVISDRPTYIGVNFGTGYVVEEEYREYNRDNLCDSVLSWAQQYEGEVPGYFASALQTDYKEGDYFLAIQYPIPGVAPVARFWTTRD